MYDESNNAIIAMNAAAAAAAAAVAASAGGSVTAASNGATMVSSTSSVTPNVTLAPAVNGNGIVNASPLMNSTHLASQFLMSKDSRWLQLEVCREFQRGQCSRTEKECKFAHPPSHVDVQNGRVIACYDSIKGRCTRENPKCKYLHPPQHLKDQLVINGRQHLQLKNQICSQLSTHSPATITPSLPLVAQIIQQQQQPSQILPTTLPYQYFQQLPAGLYPTLIQNNNAAATPIDPFQLQSQSTAVMQQLALLQQQQQQQQQLQLQQHQQAAIAAAAASAAANPAASIAMGNPLLAATLAQQQQKQLQSNPALLMALMQQQQLQQQQLQIQQQSQAGVFPQTLNLNGGQEIMLIPNSNTSKSLNSSGNNSSGSSSTRKRNADVAGISKWEQERESPRSSSNNKISSTSTMPTTATSTITTAMLNHNEALMATGSTQSDTNNTAAGLLALRNQLLFANAAASNANGIPPMKRATLDSNGNSTFNAMSVAANNGNAAAVAAAAAAAAVASGPAVTNGNASIGTPFPFYAAHAAAATQFNPYMQSIQIPAAYLPAVSFNGSIPPRF